jgi:hypothetical protein
MNYVGLVSDVVALIRDAGKEVSISHVIPASGWTKGWDVATESPYWEDSEGNRVTTDPSTEQIMAGYSVEVDSKVVPEGSLEKVQTRKWLMTVVPEVGDEITTASGRTFTVQSVREIQPGDVTLYAEVEVA